jgi:hypothetical protein
MVELVEVEDESFETKQVGPSDDEDYTDTGMHNSHMQYSMSSANNSLPQSLRSPPMTKTTFSKTNPSPSASPP